MLVKLNGEYFAKHGAPASFRLAKKFGEIDPRKKNSFLMCKAVFVLRKI
jgi:hypothetical protein